MRNCRGGGVKKKAGGRPGGGVGTFFKAENVTSGISLPLERMSPSHSCFFW